MNVLETSISKTCRVTIELTEQEAQLIQSLVQNGQDNETESMRQLRETLWNMASTVISEL